MSKILYIANWKSNKTKEEAIQFFDQFKNEIATVDTSNKHIIIAPPLTLLSECKQYIVDNNLNVSLAAQNVSAFPQGAYTGEINARQIKEFVDYVIVGHSERRKYLHEDESDIANKIREATEMGIKVIQCIQDENSVIHKGAEIIAYEPPSAIGSGNPDDPRHVAEVFNS
ncbi:MAG: triose-phosphate isomerase family protein, partial [Candidatus Levybacteria bacterium]|nr:triose-phosphate isomerase family protein [Candidatus Levybacteria bacterium]